MTVLWNFACAAVLATKKRASFNDARLDNVLQEIASGGLFQIHCTGLALLGIALFLEGNLLSFYKGTHPGLFNCADVYKHVSAAVIRLDKAKPFLIAKPFYCSGCHGYISFKQC